MFAHKRLQKKGEMKAFFTINVKVMVSNDGRRTAQSVRHAIVGQMVRVFS